MLPTAIFVPVDSRESLLQLLDPARAVVEENKLFHRFDLDQVVRNLQFTFIELHLTVSVVVVDL
jgi:hypothetical protein